LNKSPDSHRFPRRNLGSAASARQCIERLLERVSGRKRQPPLYGARHFLASGKLQTKALEAQRPRAVDLRIVDVHLEPVPCFPRSARDAQDRAHLSGTAGVSRRR
jgi:hypothetical protein